MQPALCHCTVLAQRVCRECGVVPLCASHAGGPCPACSQLAYDHFWEKAREALDEILSRRLDAVDIFLSEPVREEFQWRHQGRVGRSWTLVSEPDGIAYLVAREESGGDYKSAGKPALLLSYDRQWLMTGSIVASTEFRRTVFGKRVPVEFIRTTPSIGVGRHGLRGKERFAGYRAKAVAPVSDLERCVLYLRYRS